MNDVRKRARCPFRVMGREGIHLRREVIDLLKWVGLGERMDCVAADPVRRRIATRAIAAAAISRRIAAGGRADRSRRSDLAGGFAAVHRAQQIGHRCDHRHTTSL